MFTSSPFARRSRIDDLVTPFAIAAGLVAGWVDFHNLEVHTAVALVLLGAGLAGLAQPRHAWRWAVTVALGVPAAYFIGQGIGATPANPPWPGLWVTLVALIPGFIGAYTGAFTRRAVLALL